MHDKAGQLPSSGNEEVQLNVIRRVDIGPDEMKNYILEMLQQLGRLASEHDDPVLTAMIAEVVRRQGLLMQQKPTARLT